MPKENRLFLLIVILAAALGIFLIFPDQTKSVGTLTSASATLGNPRLSFSGQVNTGASAGVSTINIKTTGTIPDKNTNHLFPGDTVAIGVNGAMTVGSIVDSDTIALSSGLTVSVADGTTVYATQSGSLALTFTITNQIPANGYVLVTIPDAASNTNDGAPDTGASTSVSGFDLNSMTSSDIAPTGGTGCAWSTETLTAGTGSGHTYKVVTTAVCTGSPTITFDGTTKDLINPAPITTGHTQGVADTYPITIATYDSSDNAIDSVDVKVAPVEAVLVSATVDETLNFTVAGIGLGGSACGNTVDVATTAYSVPWGTISSSNTFYDAIQQLTVSTNADGGYSVKVEENDQMGKDGTTCDTPANDTADETDNPPCIKDTTCGSSACTEAAARDWTDAAIYHGLGISLEDQSGTDAVWDYNGKPAETTCTSGTFCARQIADIQASETKASIMANTGSVSAKSAYVCYRFAISGTQPAGYYYNKVKYTCTATF